MPTAVTPAPIKTDLPDSLEQEEAAALVGEGVEMEVSSTLEKPASNPEKLEEEEMTKLHKFDEMAAKAGDFVSKNLESPVAYFGAGINFFSAPLRLLAQTKSIKSSKKMQKLIGFINWFSLKCSKLHQFVYGLGGFLASFKKKNPLHVVSFFFEMVTSKLPLRGIYWFKAWPSSTDILPYCIKHLIGGTEFGSFKEGWQKTVWGLKKIMKEIKEDPAVLFRKENLEKHVPVVGAIISSLGASWCGFVEDIYGGLVRNFGGILNDFGLLFQENEIEQTSGKWYIGGSAFDASARLVQLLGSKLFGLNKDLVSGLRDMFHELGLGADKLGQRFFVKAVNQSG